MYRTLGRHGVDWVRSTLRGDVAPAFEHELWLCFFAGVVRQRWSERHVPVPPPQVSFSS
jgi:hypothetical protein